VDGLNRVLRGGCGVGDGAGGGGRGGKRRGEERRVWDFFRFSLGAVGVGRTREGRKVVGRGCCELSRVGGIGPGAQAGAGRSSWDDGKGGRSKARQEISGPRDVGPEKRKGASQLCTVRAVPPYPLPLPLRIEV
jgi:hypothetical protein